MDIPLRSEIMAYTILDFVLIFKLTKMSSYKFLHNSMDIHGSIRQYIVVYNCFNSSYISLCSNFLRTSRFNPSSWLSTVSTFSVSKCNIKPELHSSLVFSSKHHYCQGIAYSLHRDELIVTWNPEFRFVNYIALHSFNMVIPGFITQS